MIWYLKDDSKDISPIFYYVQVTAFKGKIMNSSQAREIVLKLTVLKASPVKKYETEIIEFRKTYEGRYFETGIISTHTSLNRLVEAAEYTLVHLIADVHNLSVYEHQKEVK